MLGPAGRGGRTVTTSPMRFSDEIGERSHKIGWRERFMNMSVTYCDIMSSSARRKRSFMRRLVLSARI